MTGYIKCEICGKFFTKDDNEKYDGLMPYYYDSSSIAIPLDNRTKEITDSDSCGIGVPEMIDMCSGCFGKFTSWIKIQKGDAQND